MPRAQASPRERAQRVVEALRQTPGDVLDAADPGFEALDHQRDAHRAGRA